MNNYKFLIRVYVPDCGYGGFHLGKTYIHIPLPKGWSVTLGWFHNGGYPQYWFMLVDDFAEEGENTKVYSWYLKWIRTSISVHPDVIEIIRGRWFRILIFTDTFAWGFISHWIWADYNVYKKDSGFSISFHRWW